MIKLALFTLFFFSFHTFACGNSKIRYVSFQIKGTVQEYMDIEDLNIKLPVKFVDKKKHGSGGYILTTSDSGVVAVDYLKVEKKYIDKLFDLAHVKSEDYCEFESISEFPSLNFSSHFIEVEYSFIKNFILAKGLSPSRNPLNVIYMRVGLENLVIIANIPIIKQNEFIENFISLNVVQ